VLGLLPPLVAISLDGRVTDGPLPDGYLVLTATSQPDTFILRKDDRAAPEAMQGPFSAYLWRRGDERPRAVMDNVWSARSAEDGLAWLEGNAGAWHFLRMTQTHRAIWWWRRRVSPPGVKTCRHHRVRRA